MKKVVFYIAACLMIFTSCEKGIALESSETESEIKRETAPVSLTFFDVSLEDVVTPVESRADDEESSLNTYFTHLDVTFFPMSDTGDTVKVHQTNVDENFGKVNTSLQVGSYKMVAIAHRSNDSIDIDDMTLVTFPDFHVTDMAYVYTTLNVDKTTNVHACQLDRAIACFKLQSNDSSFVATTMKITYKNGCSNRFNPSTSLAVNPQEYSFVYTLDPARNGKPRQCNFYTFLKEKTQNVDICVEVLDKADKVISQLNFEDVKLEQKKRTIYTGNVFSLSQEVDFTSAVKEIGDIVESDGSKEF